MEGSRLAVRYAKSLLDLALEKGELEKVYADMKLVYSTIKENRDLRVMLESPIVKTDKKGEILIAIFGGKISEMSLAFFKLMAAKNRESKIEAISKEFIEQYKTHKRIITAVITTAQGLDEDLRNKVITLVKDSMKGEVELVEKVDASIIGGFILRIGDKQDNTSISRKLKLLTRTFSENPYIKDY
jgi:F-type H+-transporting ATPase subunit delta